MRRRMADGGGSDSTTIRKIDSILRNCGKRGEVLRGTIHRVTTSPSLDVVEDVVEKHVHASDGSCE